MDVKKNMVIDDTSIYGDPQTKLEYATATQVSTDSRSRDPKIVHCSKELIESDIYNFWAEYLLISYRAVSYMMVVRRNYKKLTTIMGEFGGVLKLVTTAVMLLYSVYSSWKMKRFFMKHLFNLNEKNSKDFNFLLKQTDLRNKRKKMREERSGGLEAKQMGQNSESAGSTQPKLLEMKEVMKICVANNLTATDILSKLQFVEALQRTFFSEDERTLLPLAILGMKREELQDSINNQKNSKKSTKEENKAINQIQSGQKISGNVYQQAYLRMLSGGEDKITGEEQGQEDRALRDTTKTFKSIREFILKNVKGFFHQEALIFTDQNRLLRIPKKEKIGTKNIINHRDEESSARNLKFVMKKNNKVAPETKNKSLFSSNSSSQIRDQRTEFTPLKNPGARRDWQGSQKRLAIGSPLRKKVSLKKSKLFFKLEDTELRKNSEKWEEIHQDQNPQPLITLARTEKKDEKHFLEAKNHLGRADRADLE